MSLLDVENIDVFYGNVHILRQVSFRVEKGETASIVGGNGAGKSTIMKAISGLTPLETGHMRFLGEPIENLFAHERVVLGLIHVPEGRRLFPYMSVKANLEMGSYNRNAREEKEKNFEKVFSLFPILEERSTQMAKTLSGGEQQMLAIGRGLMAQPKLMMMDEPSLGLAPLIVNMIFEIIETIKKHGVTVLLVEQNVKHSLEISNHGYVLENGKITIEGTGQELLKNEYLRRAYLGI